MKKLFAILMVCALMLCMASSAFAADYTIEVKGFDVGKNAADMKCLFPSDIEEMYNTDYVLSYDFWVDGYSFDGTVEEGVIRPGVNYVLGIWISPKDENENLGGDQILDDYDEIVAPSIPYTDYYCFVRDNEVYCFYYLEPFAAVPATGDGANIALWIGMMAVSAAGIVLISRKARKEY